MDLVCHCVEIFVWFDWFSIDLESGQLIIYKKKKNEDSSSKFRVAVFWHFIVNAIYPTGVFVFKGFYLVFSSVQCVVIFEFNLFNWSLIGNIRLFIAVWVIFLVYRLSKCLVHVLPSPNGIKCSFFVLWRFSQRSQQKVDYWHSQLFCIS